MHVLVSGWEMAPYIEAIDSQKSSLFTVRFTLFNSSILFFIWHSNCFNWNITFKITLHILNLAGFTFLAYIVSF